MRRDPHDHEWGRAGPPPPQPPPHVQQQQPRRGGEDVLEVEEQHLPNAAIEEGKQYQVKEPTARAPSQA